MTYDTFPTVPTDGATQHIPRDERYKPRIMGHAAILPTVRQ